VRMIDAIDAKTAKEGDTFRASLDQPIVINGATVIQRGGDAQVKLVQQAGKSGGKSDLTISLASVTVNGKVIGIDTQNLTNSIGPRGEQKGKEAAKPVEVSTKGPHIKVVKETLLTFAIEKPVVTQSAAQSDSVTPPAPTTPAPAAPQASKAAPSAPPTIKIGQTEDSVVTALGQPDSVDATGDKQVYIYKDLKVTFVNGKVSKVE
jgi:hypothetical protein